MPSPIYDDVLTKASEGHLRSLIGDLPDPVAIAGGHAVRLLVERRWRVAFGERYFGSRDIDVVYFVNPSWTRKQLADSPAGRASARIVALGYKRSGAFRFEAVLNEMGQVVDDRPPSPSLEGVDFHVLYVDLIVTHLHPDIRSILGFVPADEPLLESVFTDVGMQVPAEDFEPKALLPVPGLLVASKLKHLPQRTKDDKAIKDLCDLFALVQYGPSSLAEIRAIVHGKLQTAAELVQMAVGHSLLKEAVKHLGVSIVDYRAAVGPLAAR